MQQPSFDSQWNTHTETSFTLASELHFGFRASLWPLELHFGLQASFRPRFPKWTSYSWWFSAIDSIRNRSVFVLATTKISMYYCLHVGLILVPWDLRTNVTVVDVVLSFNRNATKAIKSEANERRSSGRKRSVSGRSEHQIDRKYIYISIERPEALAAPNKPFEPSRHRQ